MRLVLADGQPREHPVDDRPVLVLPDVVAFGQLARKLGDERLAPRVALVVHFGIAFGHLRLPERKVGAEFAAADGRPYAGAGHVRPVRGPLFGVVDAAARGGRRRVVWRVAAGGGVPAAGRYFAVALRRPATGHAVVVVAVGVGASTR